MRYAVMQILTWGTIAGAVGSALLLAALESPSTRSPALLPVVASLPGGASVAGRGRTAAPLPALAASTPLVATR